ncbi:unnamed protein product [Soboliphyme baturini]|uniref:Uncharacterized protein n=1 Tax=Soboliphyme baturini TaxID=241478 RepID=A0A183IIV3_9BILA|nr:unnamed protein product [Soboliphyme baturini]
MFSTVKCGGRLKSNEPLRRPKEYLTVRTNFFAKNVSVKCVYHQRLQVAREKEWLNVFCERKRLHGSVNGRLTLTTERAIERAISHTPMSSGYSTVFNTLRCEKPSGSPANVCAATAIAASSREIMPRWKRWNHGERESYCRTTTTLSRYGELWQEERKKARNVVSINGERVEHGVAGPNQSKRHCCSKRRRLCRGGGSAVVVFSLRVVTVRQILSPVNENGKNYAHQFRVTAHLPMTHYSVTIMTSCTIRRSEDEDVLGA